MKDIVPKKYKFHKLCKCCNLPFDTNSPQKLFCDREHYLPCPVCGKPVLKKDGDFTRKPVCCSKECTVKANQMHLPIKNCEICGQPFKARSGVATICEREHHAPCVICGKDIIITKRMWHDKIDTCSRKCALEKVRRFYRDKYGVDHPMQNSEVQKHHKAAMKSKYGVEHALQLDKFMQAAQQTNLEKFGTKYACLRDECQSKSGNAISSINRFYGNLLSKMGYDVEYEKIVNGRRYDLGIESLKTVVEIDPTWSHNSYTNHWNDPKDPSYHRTKTLIANEGGYRCIHVFEWDAKQKIVGMFVEKTRIGARQCKIEEIDTKTATEFLRKYHIQGSVRNQIFCIGLVHKGELVQVMTFGKSRYDKKCDVELLRLCSKCNISVTGGSEKLFKYALSKNLDWKSIISYCDLAKFDGDVYPRLGMKLVRTTPPAKVWSKGTDKITDMLLRQRGFDQLFGTDYGKGTSNEQLMIDDEWLPVYDCGQKVFVYER